jgi:6-phosphofructokinase 2
MTDIVTLTMNPCVDVSTVTERVQPTRKLRCQAPTRQPGGGGINVARVLHRLGASCLAVYPAGGDSGALLGRLLQAEQVPARCLLIAGETRESMHVRDESAQTEYRFVMPGPNLHEREWQACLDAIAALQAFPSYLVASGSLPPGVPDDFYARLARLARARGARLVLDASGPALAAALQEGVYLFKPSLGELRALSGESLERDTQWQRAAQQLVKQGAAEVVVLSLGEHGALLVFEGGMTFAPALPVTVRSAVGAGDSLVGGMLQALANGFTLREAFVRGMASATAALLATGTSLCQPADVERLQAQVMLQDL